MISDEKIIKMRKDKHSFIKTIQNEILRIYPFNVFDEQIALAHVLNILDKNGFAVSRNEVRTAFNQYFVKEHHGDKTSYISWLCKEFGVKKGAITNASQIRGEASSGSAVSQTREAQYPTHRQKSTQPIHNTNKINLGGFKG